MSNLASYVCANICRACGGRCCEIMPGSASPEDFGAPDRDAMRERIAEALATGDWTVDHWEDVSPSYYMRPAISGKEGRAYHAGWGGECTFHGDDGCRIFDTRPSGCRGLKPSRSHLEHDGARCTVKHSDKYSVAMAWKPYDDLLLDMANESENQRRKAS